MMLFYFATAAEAVYIDGTGSAHVNYNLKWYSLPILSNSHLFVNYRLSDFISNAVAFVDFGVVVALAVVFATTAAADAFFFLSPAAAATAELPRGFPTAAGGAKLIRAQLVQVAGPREVKWSYSQAAPASSGEGRERGGAKGERKRERGGGERKER